MTVLWDNLREVYSKKSSWLISIVTLGVMLLIFHIKTNYALIKGNYGAVYLYFQVISQTLISFLFALFLAIAIYKYVKFSNPKLKKAEGASFIATIVAIILGGCPGCSITLVTYLGLSGVVSLLPYNGLEIKLITIPLLIFASYSTLQNLNTCSVKKKKKKK